MTNKRTEASPLEIISNGKPVNTHLHCGGVELSGVTSLEIEPILPCKLLRAKVIFERPTLDIFAEVSEIKYSSRIKPTSIQNTISIGSTVHILSDGVGSDMTIVYNGVEVENVTLLEFEKLNSSNTLKVKVTLLGCQ